MMGVDTIEFYLEGHDKHIAVVKSSMPPDTGDFVSIGGKTYLVKGRTFAVDHSADWSLTAMRCNVDVVLYSGKRAPKRKRRAQPQDREHD